MKTLFASLFALLLTFDAFAQKFDYNVRLDYTFDNYEFAHSNDYFDASGTIHAVRLTPTVGIMIPQRSESVVHRVMLGIDLMKNFGDGNKNWDIFDEMVFYYNVEAAFSRGRKFSAIAGCFPRSFSEGKYGGPFFSEGVRFLDNNFEGMFFKYRTPKLYAEIGLDWMGKIGDESHPYRRERFQVLTSGKWNFASPFSLGWAGAFYHFACAPRLQNIVDNDILNLRVEWNPRTSLDIFEITAGWIATYQWDRKIDDSPCFPGGFLTLQSFEKWNVGISNSFYCGGDIMPFYERSFGGVTYGSDLYFGEPCFHTCCAGTSWNDILKIYYAPKITDFLHLNVGLEFHIGDPSVAYGLNAFRGWRQTVSLRFDLAALRPNAKPLKRRGFRFGDFFDL